MANVKLPDPLARRHLLEGNLDAAKARAFGEAYLDAGREVEAAARYRSVLVIEPEHLGALNNYADLLVQAGCRDEARALITRAVEIGSDNPRLRSIIESTAEQIARMPGGKNGRCQQ